MIFKEQISKTRNFSSLSPYIGYILICHGTLTALRANISLGCWLFRAVTTDKLKRLICTNDCCCLYSQPQLDNDQVYSTQLSIDVNFPTKIVLIRTEVYSVPHKHNYHCLKVFITSVSQHAARRAGASAHLSVHGQSLIIINNNM